MRLIPAWHCFHGSSRLAAPYRKFVIDSTACVDNLKVSDVSAASGRGASSQIEEETLKKRISNNEYRMSNPPEADKF